MPASVSPVSGNLGNKETAAVTPYVVSAQSGTTVTQIVERVNGIVTNTVNNPASLVRTLTIPQANWDALKYYATHTATVTVTDSGGGQVVVSYTFVNQRANNASLLEAAKANTDARARISTKRDALAAQVGLSAGATFDAISAQLASGAFKKFASGIADSTSYTSGYYNRFNDVVMRNNVIVSGLTFLPSTILLFPNSGTAFNKYVVFHKNYNYDGFESLDINVGGTFLRNDIAAAYVNATGFSLPYPTSENGVNWIAFE